MRLQSSQANCGPTSLYNAGCALGKSLSVEDCERACRTDATEGTNVRRLMAGAKALGFKLEAQYREGKPWTAARTVDWHLGQGHAALIVVDADSHWVAVVGKSGHRYLVADSSDSELVLSYSEGELLQRWQTPETRRGFYALVVS